MNDPRSRQHPPPRTLYAVLELGRAVQEMTTLLPANRWLSGLPGGDGQPVMTLPGFGGADGSTALLRRYITRWGYEAHPWDLGRNFDPGSSRDMSGVLDFMDEVYSHLVTVDFPDAVTDGLRRQTDLVRGIIERTRADLTLSLREQHLQEALQKFSEKFPGMGE